MAIRYFLKRVPHSLLALCVIGAVVWVPCSAAVAQDDAPNSAVVRLPESPEQLHLFLLVGQSNMAGRGKVEDQDRQTDPRILSLNKQQEWEFAVDPLHFDKPKSVGVGLGKTFALNYAKAHPGITVGLIPCAVGGSPIRAWVPGGFHDQTKSHPWDDMVPRLAAALKSGTLKGVLWHQGESDSNQKQAAVYEEKLHDLIQRIRALPGVDGVPFLAGQLGQFPERPWNEHRLLVNQAHESLPAKIANTAFVSSDDLQHKGDKTHFDSASYREFGRRYFTAFQKLAVQNGTTDVVTSVDPWENIEVIKAVVPTVTWLDQNQPIHSLLYGGETFNGKPTEVFAFYASPITLGNAKPGETFPAVVLIHGGGGTAFARWVHLWAKRGYAAIAMDLSGMRPPAPEYDAATGLAIGPRANRSSRVRLANGGPLHGHPQKFDSIGGTISDDWPFHAVASVVRAHSLIRSFPEVDKDRTAVTGISWGGYTTCLVASLDDRFKAAVPVYGCGFLHEGESVQKPAIDALNERGMDWVHDYDPGSLLPRCQVPILFVNGTNDKHYPLDSYMKSFNAVPGPKQLRVTVKMRHGHEPGWQPQEIGQFIDSKCQNGVPLPVPGIPVINDGQVTVAIESQTKLSAAQLHYTTDDGPRVDRDWQTVPAMIEGNTITVAAPPETANSWFLTMTDETGATVSTTVVLQ